MVDIQQVKAQLAKAMGGGTDFHRHHGVPHKDQFTIQAGRIGNNFTPAALPTQAGVSRTGQPIKADVSNEFVPSTDVTGGVYRIGSPSPPQIKHDRGFANKPKEEPTLADRINLVKWYAMLEGAEAIRPDLVDALGAYRHFLEGEGRPRTFSYERYVMNDKSGRRTLRNALVEGQLAAIELWRERPRSSFSFTGPPIRVGELRAFPYPATENWMKTIGAHTLWLSGDVQVGGPPGGKPHFSMTLTIHAEDRYNFNPGSSDVSTGLPDDANGRFVVVGWAHGYRHTSQLQRRFRWLGTDLGIASMGIAPVLRASQPSNNRRARNRL